MLSNQALLFMLCLALISVVKYNGNTKFSITFGIISTKRSIPVFMASAFNVETVFNHFLLKIVAHRL